MSIAKRLGAKFLSLALCFIMLTSLVTPALAESMFPAEKPLEEDYITSTNWIWSSDKTVKHTTAYFRKEVNLSSVPIKISVKTSAHNHLKYYVNGNLVTGYVTPANASLPENVNYLSYSWEGEELDALLNEDKTQLCLAAAVQYMGEKSSNYVTGKPGFWTEVTVTYANGDPQIIESDTSWRTSDSTPFAETQAMFARHGLGTQINNTIGMTVDCPHREQAQYLADSQLQYALFSYAFEEAPEFIYKTLFDFATQQREDGRFEYTSPTTQYVAPEFYSIPEWDLRYTAILHRYYELTGSLEAVAEFYDNAASNVDYYYAKIDSAGLLIDEPGVNNISDHPGKAFNNNPGSPPTVTNLLLYDSLNRLSVLAALLDKGEESAQWAEKASALKQNINVLLRDSETGLYKNYLGTDGTNIAL
ncbi:MAG: hypothetical protein IKJ74_07265 [Clostridia bacterium]|nr:hypothetical protein [Clostridia bacterium]